MNGTWGANGHASYNGAVATQALPIAPNIEYVQYSNEELIYRKNEMYIGSMAPEHIEQLHFDWNRGTLDVRTSWYIQALINVYLEILLNASDNAYKSIQSGFDPKTIEINLSPTIISVKNYGLSIAIERNEMGIWKPEFIFGYTNTSGNYNNDNGGTAGRFGQGAKITNIYSLRFFIEIVNNGKKYKQYWEKNKTIRSEPTIEDTNEPNSTTVTWLLDFHRFGLTEYSSDMLQVMAHEAVLVGMAVKVPIYINGISYDFRKLTDYADIVHRTSEKIYHSIQMEDGYIEFCAISTNGFSRIVSLCNAVHTKNHGKYVDATKKALFTDLVATINNKWDTRPKEERTRALVTMSSLEGEFSLIINYWSKAAKFSGQFKSEQQSPVPVVTIPEALLKKIEKWSLVTRIVQGIGVILSKIMAKTDGKKKREYSPEGKATSASDAGTKNSGRCILFVVEGDSAASYIETMISLIPNGRTFIGVLPFRGKFINAFKADILKLANNEEYKEFKKEMGLIDGADYNNPATHKGLRYGRIIIMGDADVDGEHYKGLVLAMIAKQFPGLICSGKVWTRRTPQLRVTTPNGSYDFFSVPEYEKWRAETGIMTKPKYFKGLGTSNKQQIAADIQIMRDAMFLIDTYSWDSLTKAFGKGKTEERKSWIANTPFQQVVLNGDLKITDFVNIELIEYSRASIIRAIPRFEDGLKRSIRQVMWGCLKYFDYGHSVKSISVANLGSEIAIKVHYHHDPKSLQGAIKLIAADYVGSGNNAPELVPDGMFGTRKELGDDSSSARYVHSYLQPWVRYLYRKEDEKLLTLRSVEDAVVEPEFLLPVIPRLFNGTKGMGTGWSTVIPTYRPSDIIYWYKARLTNNQTPALTPWYRGYTGRVIPKEDNVILEGNVELIKETETTYNVRITEIPIITSVDDYRIKTVKRLYDDHHVLVDKDIGAADTIYFELQVSKASLLAYMVDGKDILDFLDLRKSVPTTNMTFIGSHNVPVIYRDIAGYLESFYVFRLPYYLERKQLILESILSKRTKCEQRIRLTQILLNYPGNIVRFKKADMLKLLRENGIPEEMLNRKIYSLSEEDIIETEQKMRQLEVEYLELNAKAPEQLWLDDLLELEKHIPM